MPEVFLGESPLEAWQTTGATITEIVNWLNEVWNPTKRGATGAGRDAGQDALWLGTIEPATYAPRSRQNNILCSEAIIQVLRWHPDAVLWIDPTTPVPTINVRLLGRWSNATLPPTFLDYTNLPEVEIDITNDQEKRILLGACNARRLNGCIVTYKETTTIDGVVTYNYAIDASPGGVDSWSPFCSRHFVELAGSSLSYVRAQVTVLAAPDFTSTAWWMAHDTSLRDPTVDPMSIAIDASAITVTDDNGNPINLAVFPNELLSPLPNWTGCLAIRAHVATTVAFVKYTEATLVNPDTKVQSRPVSRTIILTNAVSRLYRTVSAATTGEVPPQGVAESVYRSTNAPQYQGEITLLDKQLRSTIGIGCRLKLVGPNTVFANVLVQQLHQRPHWGQTTVKFGPSAPAEAEGLIELARASRWRTTYNMPSGRASGQIEGTSDVDFSGQVPQNDTAHGPGGESRSGSTYTHP